jgi:hypothetical protein
MYRAKLALYFPSCILKSSWIRSKLLFGPVSLYDRNSSAEITSNPKYQLIRPCLAKSDREVKVNSRVHRDVSSTYTLTLLARPYDPDDFSAMSNSTLPSVDGIVSGKSNPLVGLAVTALNAILYVLDQFKNLVTWCTLTFPGYVHQI